MQAQQHYIYRHSPIQPGAFQIFLSDRMSGRETYCGDYTVLDDTEPPSLSELKMINLMSLLNGKTDLIDLGAQTQSRLMYQRLPDAPDGQKRVLFRTYNGEGLPEENAILTYYTGDMNA